MLTAAAIMSAVENKEIVISDFSTERLNPNSYNLRLSPKLLRYTSHNLDMFKENPVEEIEISKDGYLLRPDEFYLGSTIESTYTPKHIPCIDGRSSIARLGIFVHVTAGFGDIGFNGRWTLESIRKLRSLRSTLKIRKELFFPNIPTTVSIRMLRM